MRSRESRRIIICPSASREIRVISAGIVGVVNVVVVVIVRRVVGRSVRKVAESGWDGLNSG